MTDILAIYCCGCGQDVAAFLTSGENVYSNREDLAKKPFWRCDQCRNFVGCHDKTKTPTKPLGCIPTPKIKNARRHIHKLIDPLWQNWPEPFRARAWIYRWLSGKLGYQYHTAEIRSVEEARKIYKLCLSIKKVEDCQ
tara:strand:- start:707 stop:1120 length:414 start_codon:yes stop_codon:yes gene_type:complete